MPTINLNDKCETVTSASLINSI